MSKGIAFLRICQFVVWFCLIVSSLSLGTYLVIIGGVSDQRKEVLTNTINKEYKQN